VSAPSPEERPILTDRAPFSIWLRAQAARADRVGSFAQAALDDPAWPGGGEKSRIVEYLRAAGVRSFVVDTLDEAWAEFQKSHQLFLRTHKRRQKNKAAKAARKKNR
jgi:hypothetical protein